MCTEDSLTTMSKRAEWPDLLVGNSDTNATPKTSLMVELASGLRFIIVTGKQDKPCSTLGKVWEDTATATGNQKQEVASSPLCLLCPSLEGFLMRVSWQFHGIKSVLHSHSNYKARDFLKPPLYLKKSLWGKNSIFSRWRTNIKNR